MRGLLAQALALPSLSRRRPFSISITHAAAMAEAEVGASLVRVSVAFRPPSAPN